MRQKAGRTRLERWAKSPFISVPLYSSPVDSQRAEKLMWLSCQSTLSSPNSLQKFG